jgi:hypothetical protein
MRVDLRAYGSGDVALIDGLLLVEVGGRSDHCRLTGKQEVIAVSGKSALS